MGDADFCSECGDLLTNGKCLVCEDTQRANAIIEGRVILPDKADKVILAGKHDLPIGLRNDAHRRGRSTSET